MSEKVVYMSREKRKIIEIANTLLSRNRIFSYIEENLGTPLFLIVSGAHMFGFPSKNSDVDIRGVYITPTEKILGLNRVKQNYRLSKDDLDLSICELHHFLTHVLKSNGRYFEWVNSPYLIFSSKEFNELKNITNFSMSKELYNYYKYFAKRVWNSATKTKEIKEILYTFRIYMTGITILRDQEVISDINKLNERFNIPIVKELVEYKKEEEHIQYSEDLGNVEKELNNLSKELDQSFEKSDLPLSLPNKRQIENHLIELRKKYF